MTEIEIREAEIACLRKVVREQHEKIEKLARVLRYGDGWSMGLRGPRGDALRLAEDLLGRVVE